MVGSEKDDFDSEFDRINREFDETKQAVDEQARQISREVVAFDRQWEAERADWEEMDRELGGMTRDFFRAITNSEPDLGSFEVRTAAQFERFLDWHDESSKLWRNGYIGDELQAQISEQFSPEAMASWRLNLMEDAATPDQVLALQERMLEVSEHATFLNGHLENQAADATTKPEALSPITA